MPGWARSTSPHQKVRIHVHYKYQTKSRDPELRSAWAEWLAKQDKWTHFGTFTFARRVGWWGAKRRWSDYETCLFDTSVGPPVATCVGVFGEMQQCRGVPHYHSVLTVPVVRSDRESVYVQTLERLWAHNGFARVVPIRTEGACYYTSKYVSKSDYEFRIARPGGKPWVD